MGHFTPVCYGTGSLLQRVQLTRSTLRYVLRSFLFDSKINTVSILIEFIDSLLFQFVNVIFFIRGVLDRLIFGRFGNTWCAHYQCNAMRT